MSLQYVFLWRLRLILAKNYFIHFPYAVYHRCVYKHLAALAAAYNEMGTMGTNQSAVRFTDLYIIPLDAVPPITKFSSYTVTYRIGRLNNDYYARSYASAY